MDLGAMGAAFRGLCRLRCTKPPALAPPPLVGPPLSVWDLQSQALAALWRLVGPHDLRQQRARRCTPSVKVPADHARADGLRVAVPHALLRALGTQIRMTQTLTRLLQRHRKHQELQTRVQQEQQLQLHNMRLHLRFRSADGADCVPMWAALGRWDRGRQHVRRPPAVPIPHLPRGSPLTCGLRAPRPLPCISGLPWTACCLPSRPFTTSMIYTGVGCGRQESRAQASSGLPGSSAWRPPQEF